MKTKTELFQQLEVAYNDFTKYEYLEDEYVELKEDVQILPIAYTDEVFDYEDKYEYCIKCSLDLQNEKDIYEMYNEYIHVTVVSDMSYEAMIESLSASFDDWVSSENGLDYDYVSELIDKHLENNDDESELENLRSQGIIVNFEENKNRTGEINHEN